MRLMSVIISVYLGFFSQGVFAQGLKHEIYSKLKNPRCNMVLSECNCPEVKEIKGYIDGLLEAGITRDEVFYKVAKKFTLKVILDNELKQAVEKRMLQEIGESRPQIVLEPADYFDASASLSINPERSRRIDFGKVDKKQGQVKKTFKLYNKGKADLAVTNIAVSCSCVSVSLAKGADKSPYFGTKGAPSGWRQELKPNESADVEVVLDLHHKSVRIGDLLREIMISSNDPLYPEISVTVKAQVFEEVSTGVRSQQSTKSY